MEVGEDENRHFNMIELLKDMNHFETNEIAKLQQLDNRLQFLESLMPSLPTASNYDATLSATLVKYVRDNLAAALSDTKRSTSSTQWDRAVKTTAPTFTDISEADHRLQDDNESFVSLQKQRSTRESDHVVSVDRSTRPHAQAADGEAYANKVSDRKTKVEIAINSFRRYNEELATPCHCQCYVNGKLLYTTQKASIMDFSDPKITPNLGKEEMAHRYYSYKWNLESFTLSRKTLETVIKSNAQAYIVIAIVPSEHCGGLGNETNLALNDYVGKAKLYLENIIETLNSPTTTRIKLNVLKDDGSSNDIIEIELRELMF